QKCDTLIIGGAMANTFLRAQGKNTQSSRIEEDKLALARTILEKARAKNVEVLLPVDVVVAKSLEATEGQTVSVDAIPEGTMALDIGPKSVDLFSKAIVKAKTVLWNGPMGLFETAAFSKGTFAIAEVMSNASGFTVVGGGASLELIEGKKLPGVEALRTTEVH
ncbi:MAG TPA: phosphoglycerate kinase, partial [Byssovorax sp.]